MVGVLLVGGPAGVLAVAFLREPVRELAMLALAAISLWQTPREIRGRGGKYVRNEGVGLSGKGKGA